ncbi:hypothetical protein O6H91_19G056400 [Diphasiastrum complanatum]|uniref:Uncharacterized protein n=1 Tax=Diphasiastrum complanatum TaxID=34168 RepID=A0ACC2AVD9_DIPCM|nr:hypothetical protein O6H91_19G056400 [Diphasiastrum complanatum]
MTSILRSHCIIDSYKNSTSCTYYYSEMFIFDLMSYHIIIFLGGLLLEFFFLNIEVMHYHHLSSLHIVSYVVEICIMKCVKKVQRPTSYSQDYYFFGIFSFKKNMLYCLLLLSLVVSF